MQKTQQTWIARYLLEPQRKKLRIAVYTLYVVEDFKKVLIIVRRELYMQTFFLYFQAELTPKDYFGP